MELTNVTTGTNPPENKYLNDLRADPNNMSKWLPAIMPKEGETRELRIPRTAIIQVPDDVCDSFFMERPGDRDRIIGFVKNRVMPEAKNAGLYPRIFMKSGGFSDKYRFDLCTPGPDEVNASMNLIAMNYDTLCFDAGGITEVCVRELIPHDERTTPCIYHGMPLRPEFRVFYDFDRHEPLYVVNYWDYCHDAICRNATDRIIYEACYPELLRQYGARKDDVVRMVTANMASVSGLEGIWSVDVMLCETQDRYGGYWLIDMAVGPRSAYWDPGRLSGDREPVPEDRDVAVKGITSLSVCDQCEKSCQGDDTCVDSGYMNFSWKNPVKGEKHDE